MAKKKEPLSLVHCRQCSYATDFIENSCFCKIRSHRVCACGMDIEIEKKIEQLEWQRMIDELATESRNKNMNKAEQARQ